MDKGLSTTVGITDELAIDVKEQMDVAEVYDRVVNLVSGDLGEGAEGGGISGWFETLDYVRSKVDPSNGRSKKVRHNYITLQPKGERSVKGALKRYGEPELLEGGNKWRDSNGDLVDAWKGEEIVSYPHVGVFRLNRFQMDDYGTVSKYEGKLRVEPTLRVKGEGWRYRLRSVVVHRGAYGYGHYYAYVLRGGRGGRGGGVVGRLLGNGEEGGGGWWLCNDEIVTRVRWKDVKEDVYKNGYMAFYEKEQIET
ncbi:hypothetical protein TrCOL_g462 [Triparma columacea]|uniref:USP domain-containing protein n=1 Tax=Triparma columacea TaxID=722753 RepID=A0A9W7GNL4_9STRA|nr:hypothetical protein TrCOL_g462 [Triparma columacea]